MKKLIGILLIAVVALEIVAPALPAIVFSWHQTEIANQLCEQKDAEENTCSGQCYLKAQLESNENPTNDAESQHVEFFQNLKYLSGQNNGAHNHYLVQFGLFKPYQFLIDQSSYPSLIDPPENA